VGQVVNLPEPNFDGKVKNKSCAFSIACGFGRLKLAIARALL
jgi:hypothetical protein